MTMYQQKKNRDYKGLWILSIFILAIGIVLTIELSMIRALGFVLLGVGGFGLIWSLTNMEKGGDGQDRDNMRHYN